MNPLLKTTLGFIALLGSGILTQAAPIPLADGTAAQSTQVGAFAADRALDDVINFTHTQGTDANPTWQVLLPDEYAFNVIEAFNREASDGATNCCPSRFRDITIQVVDFTGDASADFDGGTVVYSSVLLNPENIDGGGTNTAGPVSLTTDAGGAIGNMIRIIRTPDPDLSGTGGLGNTDEASVLSMDLVTADGMLRRLSLAPNFVDAVGAPVTPSSAVIGDSVGTLTYINDIEQEATFTLTAGDGDTNNGSYMIGGPDGDQLLVNADLTPFTDQVHSVLITGTFGAEVPITRAFTFTITTDTDNDTLPDVWELMFGALADFAPGQDADMDGLNDEDEFTLGTDPSKADGDDDGVDDIVELADGTDPNIADTDGDGLNDGGEKLAGSDPQRTDTDGDSLRDGDEVNVHNTNPTLADTDGDTFNDNIEVVRGSNPNVLTSTPVLGVAIPLASGTVAQSTQLGTFAPELVLDGVVNFNHTTSGDANPTWQVLLPTSEAFGIIEAFNRQASDGATDCCPSRMRDYTIEVVQFSGDVLTDFTGGTVIYSSGLLNPENEIGGNTNTAGPVSLIVDAGGAVGNMLRIRRTPDPDLSGTSGAGNADEGAVLSMDLVTAELSAGGLDLQITEIVYDMTTEMITLTWPSRDDRTYAVFFGLDLISFDSDIDDSIASMGAETSFTFQNPVIGSREVFFRVEENPPN